MRLIADLISRTRDELHGLASRLLGRFGGAIHAITAQAYASGFVGPRATLGALRTAARLNGTARFMCTGAESHNGGHTEGVRGPASYSMLRSSRLF